MPDPDSPGTRTLAASLLRRAGTEPPQCAGRLLVLDGPGAGQVISLGAEETLGRGGRATLRLDDPALSRVHLRLRAAGGRIWAEDLGSKNGTWVDGRRLVRKARALRQSDVVAAGTTRLRIAPLAPAGPVSPGPMPAPPLELLLAGAALAAALALALLAVP